MTQIPEWILKYDKANYQSAAGKAVRELITIIHQLQPVPSEQATDPVSIINTQSVRSLILSDLFHVEETITNICKHQGTDPYETLRHINWIKHLINKFPNTKDEINPDQEYITYSKHHNRLGEP